MRQTSRRLARRTAERLPHGAQRTIREAWRLARPYVKRAFYSRPASPLVSIVIPVYNVERYLSACLDSVLSQSYRHLQVILVDDGSPDRSIDIMQSYAARDRRIRIVRTPNAGLGAARNTGARYARGRFLMFVDSDDVLRPDAIRTYVRTLRRTGSDFAVGAYDRMTSHQTWPAAWWIRSAHQFSRLGTTIAESPDAVVNAVAWSKCYRRKFWEQNGFAFPEGVLYEDQALSARAYAKATRFDILAKITYGWRVREDRSSITQQATALNDLKARLRAAEDSLAELDGPRLEHVRNTRLAQYLSNDFPLSIKTAQHSDDEFWELLTAGLHRLTDRAGSDVWDKVSAQHRVAIKLVTSGHRDEVVDFVGLGHNNPKNSPVLVSDGHIYLQTPHRQALGLAPTDPLLALADHQLGLVTRIRRAGFDKDHRFHVHGWAYIDNVDLAQVDPAERGTTITAVDLKSGHRVQVPVELRPSAEVTRNSRHRYADYEPSVFDAVFDLPAAVGEPGADRSDWQLQVTVSAAGIVWTGELRTIDPESSAARLAADFLPDGLRATPSYSGRTGLHLVVDRPACTVSEVTLTERTLSLRVDGGPTFAPHEVEISADESGQRVRVPVNAGPDSSGRVVVTLPENASAPETVDALTTDRIWRLSVIAADGTRRTPAWPRRPDRSARPGQSGPLLWPDAAGGLTVLDEPAGSLLITDAEVTTDGLRLSGQLVNGFDHGPVDASAGAADAGVVVGLHAPRISTTARVAASADGSFSVVVPLTADPWRSGELPLPSGDYRLVAHRPTGAGTAPVAVHPAGRLVDQLPVVFRTDRLFGRITFVAPDGLGLSLVPPLADDELGPRRQQQLQDRLRDRVDDPAHESGAVLLRSYYGEICGCNPRALHEYLRDHQPPGGPYTSYFAIKDYSVQVPDGAIPVLYESAEWYRLLHDAVYYMDNMHQPIYHTKPRHQIQIQTFHGYPFKQMGLSHWAMQHRDVAHVRSYLARAADWDYLVSPASYGTEALVREFGFPNTVLEIGYPRNDVLLSAAADKISAQVRERLGIRPGQTAVLYGPTFRDSMSNDDNTAAMVDFLDIDRLAHGLGDDFVIMVRGHAFNARLGARVGTRGTIIDVTDYPDIAELCLASDAAILDYSSLRFDYGLTGKPMIFMVPDLLQYQTEARGSLWAYEPTAPGPLVGSTEEVITALLDLDRVRSEHAEAYATFRRDFLDLDDGHATERLVNAVFPPA